VVSEVLRAKVLLILIAAATLVTVSSIASPTTLILDVP
jgi:hypothetical protein